MVTECCPSADILDRRLVLLSSYNRRPLQPLKFQATIYNIQAAAVNSTELAEITQLRTEYRQRSWFGPSALPSSKAQIL